MAFSVNAPLSGRVRRIVDDLASDLTGFDRVREEPTLVVKRLGEADPGEFDALVGRVRRALRGAAPVEARVSGIGVFRNPASGPGPVVYLAVEGPGLADLHRRLAAVVEPVPGIEGDDYVPHVTLARGGDPGAADRLAARRIGPTTWVVRELLIWDARHREPAGRIRLPA